MKTRIMIKKLGLSLVTLFLMMLSSTSYSQVCAGNNVEITLKNIVVTSNAIEYDVMLKNVSSPANTIRLSGLNGNVRYTPGLFGAGTATLTVVDQPNGSVGTGGQFPLSNNVIPTHTPATQQMRWTQSNLAAASGLQVSLPIGTDMKFARFRISSTQPLALSSYQLFIPTSTTGGITVCNITMLCNVNTANANLTFALGTLSHPTSPYNLPVVLDTCFTAGTAVPTGVTCFGDTNGSAVITMSPAPSSNAITYTVDGGASTPGTLVANAFSVSGLTAGDHTVVVTGSGTCTTPRIVMFTVGGPLSPLTNVTNETACDSFTWSVTGLNYTTGGTYTGTTTNGSGCTVSETLNLTINNSTSGTNNATACDTFTWSGPLGNGNTYTTNQTGLTHTSTNVAGCPHVETLNLTINNSTTGTNNATACDTFTWSGPLGNGNTYTTNQTGLTHTSTNVAGCPHVETLNLTINNSTTGTNNATACDTFTWSGPLGNGNTYTTSQTGLTHTTTNVAGCPHVETLNLTINNSTTDNSLTITANDTYTWSLGLGGNGTTYTASGVYTFVTTNVAGCPNTATLTLTINITGTPTTWYQDFDGDTYGNPAVTLSSVSQPLGYVANNTDCNDAVAAINPGAFEVLYDGVDNNCNGQFDEPSPLTTSMQGCGATLATISSLVCAVSSPAALITGYRFEVTRVGSLPLEVQTIDRTSNCFNLTLLSSYAYASTYSIRCMLQRNGVWLGYYGPACNFSSPAVLAPGGSVAVTPSQCGITIPTISTLIATTSLAGVTGYKFRVTNLRTSFQQELTRTLHWFSLNMLTQYVYGDTYSVEVAVKTTGTTFSGYGSSCNVTAPPVPSLTSQCGTIIPAKSTNIVTASLNLVTSYDFEVRNETTLVTANVSNNLNWFRLSMLPNYAASTQFRVRVRVLTSGVFSDYGDACFITSPAVARTVETVNNNVFEVTASPNPFDNNFGMFLNSTSTEDVSIRVYDMIGKLVEQREVKSGDVVIQEIGARFPSGVYNVIVTQGAEVKTLRVIKR